MEPELPYPALAAVMPDVSRSLRRGNPWSALESLRSVLDRGQAGEALLELVRLDPGWRSRVHDWVSAPGEPIPYQHPGAADVPGLANAVEIGSLHGLTDRETTVLVLAAEGLMNGEIAEVLGIGRQTVASHVAAILRKLQATNRAHAVGEAFRRGILD